MQYLYLDMANDLLFATARRPVPDGSIFNGEGITQVIVDDDFNFKKPSTFNKEVMVEGTEDDPQYETVEATEYVDMTASEIMDALTYVQHRVGSYPDIAEQLDKLFHDLESGTLDATGEFYTAIKAVKDANPKP
jgi:hypothetical protein